MLQQRRAFDATRRQSVHRLHPRMSLFADILCLLIPITQALKVQFLGVIPGSEFLALLLFPFCVAMHRDRIWKNKMKALLALIACWFSAQLLTDIYRRTELIDMTKGLAAIGVFGVDLILLSVLLNTNQRRLITFGIGTIIGTSLTIYLAPNHSPIPDADFNINWKFGYTFVFTPIVMLLGCYFYGKRRYGVALGLAVSAAAVNLFFNARSSALIAILSGVIILPLLGSKSLRPVKRGPVTSSTYGRGTRIIRILLLVGCAAVTAAAANWVYSYSASSGLLGEEAQSKYEQQSRGKYGVLVGGRPEVLIEGQVVGDSPIIGHGSYAKDAKYAVMLNDILVDTGYNKEGGPIDDSDRIPVHSYVMQTWIWAGLFGVLFWFYAFWITIRALFELSTSNLKFLPFYALQIMSFLWAIIFSPFGEDCRMSAAYMLAVINFVVPPLIDHTVSKRSSTSAALRVQRRILHRHSLGLRSTNTDRAQA